MTAKRTQVSEETVRVIEGLLAEATVDTRAAVAALALPGRIRAFSAHHAALLPEDQARLANTVAGMMRSRGFVESATGISAALAINWCEKHGKDYTVRRRGDTYEVSVEL